MMRRRHGTQSHRDVRRALAVARDDAEVAAVVIEALRPMLRPADDVVLMRYADDNYDVIGGTVPGVEGMHGTVDSHPVLQALGDRTSASTLSASQDGAGERLRA